MEKALATVGNHYTMGHDVWKTVRELTAQHFDGLDGDHDAEKETAMRALFVQQMRRPLQQNDLAMSEFRAWHEYNTLEPAASREKSFGEAEHVHQRVLGSAVYKKLNQFEDRLNAALAGTPFKDADAAESPETVWTQYLRYAQSKLAPLLGSHQDADRYVVCLLERAVASVCLSSSLWTLYVDYTKTSHPSSDQIKLVLQRATRNVSFDSAFWIERVLAMETSGDSLEQISKMIETELLARSTPPVMDSAHMARTLSNYCGVVRRAADDPEEAVESMVADCRRFLETAFPEDATPQAAVLTFQAQGLAFRIRSSEDETSKEKWLRLWREILKIRAGKAEVWLSFYDEYRFTHAASPKLSQELRDVVFAPAMDAVHDYPLLVLERWLAFELTVGDRDAYAHVREKYQRYLMQGVQYRAPAAVAATASTSEPSRAIEKSTAPKKRKAERASSSSAAVAEQPAKRPKTHKTTESPTDANKTERFTNDHTVFVCNVSKDATQDELRAVFVHIPSLRDVRLVVKERGSHVKSRGMAYVQFHDATGVDAALPLNGTIVHGQPIKVEKSTPPPSGKTKSSGDPKGAKGAKQAKATTTLYVGGLLPPDREPITEEQVQHALTEVLGEGSVKQVLILTDRRGRPKEYGLVEVTDPKLVEVAVQKQHDVKAKLGDQVTVQTSRMTIDSVVRHRDEQKQATQLAKEARQSTTKTDRPVKKAGTSGSSFQTKTAPHAKPHPRLVPPVASAASLMPRALRKKIAVAAEAKPESEATTATETTTSTGDQLPKTNADFRKLFLS
jgi:RNA recognition motif-containing protein